MKPRIPHLCIALLLLPTPAAACTVCDSEAGQQVRVEIVQHHLGLGIAATLVPFLVVFAVVAVVHFGPPRARRSA